MKALCIMTIYNEIDFLPYQKEWCQRNEFDLYIIDNYSTDHSYEWLKNHNITCHQFDTRGAFDLRGLQKEIIRTTDHIKPDWVFYTGADTFIFADKPLAHICLDAEKQWKNIIGWPVLDMYRIGEEKTKKFENYWYKLARPMIVLVYKWQPGLKMIATLPHMHSYHPPGIMINYGRAKAADRRKELLKRRRLAWDRGLLKRGFGNHYLKEEAVGYTWDVNELKDIRKSQYWKYLKDYV